MSVVEVGATPNLLHDLLARHDLPGMLREDLQNQIFLRTEHEPLAADHPGSRGQIDFKRTDPDYRLAGRRYRAGPQRGAPPRNQLADTEGLDDVVVRAELQKADLLPFARAHRQHDDRDVRP